MYFTERLAPASWQACSQFRGSCGEQNETPQTPAPAGPQEVLCHSDQCVWTGGQGTASAEAPAGGTQRPLWEEGDPWARLQGQAAGPQWAVAGRALEKEGWQRYRATCRHSLGNKAGDLSRESGAGGRLARGSWVCWPLGRNGRQCWDPSGPSPAPPAADGRVGERESESI